MADTQGIFRVLERVRRRMRVQAAAETAMLFVGPAVAFSAAGLCASRLGWITGPLALWLAGGSTAVVLIAATASYFRSIPDYLVATRVDRTSALDSRLSSAVDFHARVDHKTVHGKTRGLMEAAIADAVAVLPRADVRKAAPFTPPVHLRRAALFAVLAAALSLLDFPAEPPPPDPQQLIDADQKKQRETAEEKREDQQLDQDDIDFARDLVNDLRNEAKRTRDPDLHRLAEELEELLKKAEAGEITKQELLSELSKHENDYMKDGDVDQKDIAKELAKTGKELEKNQLTKALGKALKTGDLAKAQKEMEKLANKLDSGQMSEKQKKQLAKALEKAAEKFEKATEAKEKKTETDIQERKKRIEKFQRKKNEAQKKGDKQQEERFKKKLAKEKRVLKKLQRKKQQQSSQQRRALKELHRNMKDAAKQMQKTSSDPGQKVQQEKVAARTMRKASQNTGKVDQDRRKAANQKKVSTQMTDLREALRRARRKRSGQRNQFGKNRRRQDFKRRARGARGSRKAWRRGQGKKPGGRGQGQGQGKGKGAGNQPGGQQWGDGHDPNIMGDPTAKVGGVDDDSLQGLQGRGPSVKETVQAAAQKGFATRAYKDVYTQYKDIVEEVMRSEKVPSGYKFYVKRYFQSIKPTAEPNR